MFENDPSAPKAVPCSEPPPLLRIGVIGVGRWGTNLARAFGEADGAAVTAACDCNLERLAHLPYDVRRESDCQRILAAADVDAVAIATPPNSHCELTLSALRAGKHVFVEKPMALAMRDAVRIQHLAAITGKRVMVGFVLRHHPAILQLTRMVRAGRLGNLTSIHSERGGARLTGSEHPLWWSLAPHDVSLAQHLFGQLATSIRTMGSGARDDLKSIIDFPGTRRAFLRIGNSTASRKRRVTVQGSEGVAVFDDDEPLDKLRLYDSDGLSGLTSAELSQALTERRPTVVRTPRSEPLADEVAHFVRNVRLERPFRADLSHATDVVTVLEAGERSLIDGARLVAVRDWRLESAAIHAAASSCSRASSSSLRP